MSRSIYQTKQRQAVLACLQSMPGRHVTAQDVFLMLRDSGIGRATVYRSLEYLVETGRIHKYVIDETSPACYEYAGDIPDARPDTFHFKCTRCGRLIHLHCRELAGTQSHLLAEHGLMMDPMRTVLYGLCENCRKQESETA